LSVSSFSFGQRLSLCCSFASLTVCREHIGVALIMEGLNKFTEYVNFEEIKKSVNFEDPLVYAVFAHVLFNPLMWNIVARLEYKTKFLTRLFGGHNKAACIFNGIIIFCIGLTRDYIYNMMIEKQPRFTPLEKMFDWEYTALTIDIVAGVILACGVTLVLGAYIRLGLIGTYLGDYFGILLPGKIEGFPFNVTTCPMYDGSSLNFLAFAIHNRSIVGFFVAVFVFICYRVACIFEDSFTEQIYATAAKKSESKAKKTD